MAQLDSDRRDAKGGERNIWGIHQYEGLRGTVERFIETDAFRNAILGVIIINAICLGMDAEPALHARFGPIFDALDGIVIAVFVVELALKLFVERKYFFYSGWNIFDFLVVLVSLAPNAGAFSVLRILRVFRVFRLFSVLPALRRVVDALFKAIPGIGAILAVLALLFYAAAVMSVQLFGQDFPDRFGSIPTTFLTLFQLMTLDGWSSEIVRPVMEKHWWAWMFFIPFVVLTAFTVLNLFIAVIVEALQTEAVRKVEDVREELTEDVAEAKSELSEDIQEVQEDIMTAERLAAEERKLVLAALADLRAEIANLKK
jgi:voltage-gated sodium channel